MAIAETVVADRGRARTKRALDLVLGTALAILVLPLILVLAVGVACSLRTARPFFVQERLGLRGRLFRIVKLRTLPLDADAAADKYAISGIPLTRLCRFLRRTHLDELPQLLLVPFGKMSLVGPRPEMPALAERFDRDFVEMRTAVRPGCTGLWQISVDSARLVGEAPQYDRFYVANASVGLDVWIMWRTVAMIARNDLGLLRMEDLGALKGPYGDELDEVALASSSAGEARPAAI